MKKNAYRDQVVIVTGASAGIGKSLALMLVSQCAKVMIAARPWSLPSGVSDQERWRIDI